MTISLFLFLVNHVLIAASVLGNGVGTDFLILPLPEFILEAILFDALIHFESVPEAIPYSLVISDLLTPALTL